jgi:hypothetical protein
VKLGSFDAKLRKSRRTAKPLAHFSAFLLVFLFFAKNAVCEIELINKNALKLSFLRQNLQF